MRKSVNLAPLLYESCEELSKNFQELKSPRDLAQLLQIPYKYLIYYVYGTSSNSRYTKFYIPKKSGGYRTIHSPNGSLGIVQRKLSQVLYAVYKPRSSVHGFAASCSIITNAKSHVGKKFILNLDIKDFFDSINFGRVRGLFIAKPYELDEKVATVIAQICCFDNKLPQGAPTSPIVSNLICARLDSELQRFSSDHGLFYTRYADDITFSSNRKEIPAKLVSYYKKGFSRVVLGEELQSIIKRNGFIINDKKVRLSYNKTQRQEVTGLIVNQKINVSRKYVRNIDGALHAWGKYGLEAATKTYSSKYAKKVTLPQKDTAPFLDSLRGKIEFIGSVRGKSDHLYQKLLSKFNNLRKNNLEGNSDVPHADGS